MVRPTWLVARREIAARLRTRTYQLSTIALVAMGFGAVAASQLLPGFMESDHERRIGVTPEASALGDIVVDVGAAFDLEIEAIDVDSSADFRAAMDDEDLHAVLASPDRLIFESEVDTTLQAVVAQSAFEAALPERATALGLTVDGARTLIEPATLRVELLRPAEDDDDDFYGLALVSSIVLLTAMSLYGEWILVGVIEEKSSRVVEVLLAIVTPWQLLIGKVLGILSLAVAQLVVALLAVAAGIAFFEGASLPEAGTTAIGASALWLVLGLLLYNLIYAAVGATATRPEDATGAQAPILALLFIGYFPALIIVPEEPDGLIARASSLFPVTAPFAMPVRAAATDVPLVEHAVAVLAMGAAIGAVAWLAGRVYTGAILQTRRMSVLAAFRRSRE